MAAIATLPSVDPAYTGFQSTRAEGTTFEATIKCFDFNEIENSGIDRLGSIHGFCEALKEDGFVAIKIPPLLQTLIDDVYRVEKAYFDQPIDVKEKDNHHNFGQSGYVSEQDADWAAGKKKRDIKQVFMVPPEMEKWPEGNPEFERIIKDYRAEAGKMAAQVMEYLSIYLGEELEDRETIESGVGHLLRLCFYRALTANDPQDAMWADEHGDLNGFTLLPTATIPGLELLERDGKTWRPVNVPPGYMIVNTGRQVWRKTAGMFREVPHRVKNPGGEYSQMERLSVVFFGSFSSNFDLSPIPYCVKVMTKGMNDEAREEYMRQFPKINVQQNLTARLIEMRYNKNPPRELVEQLKEFILDPPPELVDQFPDLFPAQTRKEKTSVELPPDAIKA